MSERGVTLGCDLCQFLRGEDVADIAIGAVLKVPDGLEVQHVHFLILQYSLMDHRQIGNELSFEGDDKQDNTVAQFITEARFAEQVLKWAKVEQMWEVIGNDRHVLQNRWGGFSDIHEEVYECVGCLAVLTEELVHYLRDDDGEIRLKVVDDVLEDEGNLDHKVLTRVILNDGV